MPAANSIESHASHTEQLEQLWRELAHHVVTAPDVDSFYQARLTYLVGVFAVTNTNDMDQLNPNRLNARYNEGILLACHERSIDPPFDANYDRQQWRAIFRATLAHIHEPLRRPEPDTYEALLDMLRKDPKHYYFQTR